MNKREQAMADILDTIGVSTEMKERFLSAVKKYGEEEQRKILQLLLLQFKKFRDITKDKLQRVRKVAKKQRGFLENTENEEFLETLEAQIDNL